MKKRFSIFVISIYMLMLGTPLVSASEVLSMDLTPSASFSDIGTETIETEEPFEAKSESERQQLPNEEQEIIDQLEKYLKENTNPRARNFGSTLNRLVSGIIFDTTVKRNNTIIDVVNLFGLLGQNEKSEWFDSVQGKSERYLTVYDEPTGTILKLHAYYVDNKSNKTAVVQHGYRANAESIMQEAEFLYSLGYNLIIPDARAHGKSEGTYISFGAYEKKDINGWIDQELAEKPNQKITLFGVSMGAATVMMSQEVAHENVQAIIEDCGYYSIEQQIRDVSRLITSMLQYIPLVNFINWYDCENQIIASLNDNYVKPILKIDLFSISPIDSVSKSTVPKLFIHGTEDWFIPPVAKDKLYEASIGYKDQLEVVGSGHGENIIVGGEVYKSKVASFLNNVSQLNNK